MDSLNKQLLLYNNCTELITAIYNKKRNFKNVYETSNKIIYEDVSSRIVEMTSYEMVLKFKNTSIYFRDNIIQFCLNQFSYIHDVIYIPNNQDYSFYRISDECELFQLSTVIDTKMIRFEDIERLNRIKWHFDYQHLE